MSNTRFITLLLLLMSVSLQSEAIEYKDNGKNMVVAPFGFPNRQPPAPGRVIRIPEAKISVSAQQVCGYTDFSTLVIDLPKQLLSKQYWQGISNQLVNVAKQTVLDISHALPAMLACNVSPTYCHVFNQAEMMAGVEGEISTKTCELVDNIAENTMMNEDLRQCWKSWEKAGKTVREAREICINNQGKGRGKKSGDNIAEATREAERKGHTADKFNLNKFIDDLFPDSVKTTNGTQRFNSGGHQYSRRSRVKEFAFTQIKGIEVRGSAVVRNGGTFQPNIDDDIKKETKEVKDSIHSILKEMKKWADEGYVGQDVLSKSQHLWADKQKWKRDKSPSPIYRPTIDGTEPNFLVQPEQIYSLLPVAHESVDDNQYLDQLIDRISQAAAYIKTQDKINDVLSRAIEKCLDPEYQGEVAQLNCKKIIEKKKTELQVLEHKMIGEERYRKVQEEITEMVGAAQRYRASRVTKEVYPDYRRTENTNPIPMPASGG